MDVMTGDAVSRLDAALNALKNKIGVPKGDEKPFGDFFQTGELIWRTRTTGERAGAPDTDSLRQTVSEWSELERAAADLKMEMALLRGQEGWLLSTNEDLIERLAAARSEKRRHAESLGEAYREIDRLRQALAESEESASRFKRMLGEAERQREEAASMAAFLADQITLLQTENHRLRASLEDSEAREEGNRRRERIILEALLSGESARKIGEILNAAGIITDEQLQAAIASQTLSRGRMIGAILVECGHAGELDVAQAVACQCKVYLIRLDDAQVDENNARRLGYEFCRRHACIPLRTADDRILVAMANPRDASAIGAIENMLQRRVEPLVTTPSDLTAVMGRIFAN